MTILFNYFCSEIMVQTTSTSTGTTSMGQGAVCGANEPLTDSPPSHIMQNNGRYPATPNGRTAADVQVAYRAVVCYHSN